MSQTGSGIDGKFFRSALGSFATGVTIVTTWDGKPAQSGGRIIAAGDPRVHEAAMKLLNT